ncbi:MAG: hypothetical protein Q7K37_10935, partial [Dehalococcoidia bacterium]|nr:hypothetical protein [Dehalococcoidia bacterium]
MQMARAWPLDTGCPAQEAGANGMTAPQDGAAAIPAARRYPASDTFPTGPGVGTAFPAAVLRSQHGDPVHLPDTGSGRPT